MKRLIAIVFATLLLTGLTACSHFPSWWGSGEHYQSTYPEELTQEEKEKAANYRKADRPAPQYRKQRHECIKDANGNEVCGYDCKESMGHVKCAKKALQSCVKNSYGDIACGYDCKSSGHTVKCGKYRYDNCVVNHRGDIRCGNNCRIREEDGEIICGK